MCKSKGLFDETIEPPATSDNSLPPALSYIGNKTRVKFAGDYLKQDKIVYEINLWNHVDSSDPFTRNLFLWCC